MCPRLWSLPRGFERETGKMLVFHVYVQQTDIAHDVENMPRHLMCNLPLRVALRQTEVALFGSIVSHRLGSSTTDVPNTAGIPLLCVLGLPLRCVIGLGIGHRVAIFRVAY